VIQELLDSGAFGPDLSAGFMFAIDTDPKVLKIRETATTLTHRKWYAIRNVGGWAAAANFEVQYVVQVGDITGDGKVQAVDASAVYPRVPSLTVPRPSGH
jgi:hypothetical protein